MTYFKLNLFSNCCFILRSNFMFIALFFLSGFSFENIHNVALNAFEEHSNIAFTINFE